ncbi:MAG: hypothetical protein AB1465_04200 [Patescibacteria group bacterium]
MSTKICRWFLIMVFSILIFGCDDEQENIDPKIVKTAKGLCAMRECVKGVSQAYGLVDECNQKEFFGGSFKTMFENMARLSGSSRAMPNPLTGDYQPGDLNKWFWEEMRNPVRVSRPPNYYTQGLASIIKCVKQGVLAASLPEEEFNSIVLNMKFNCLAGSDEDCEILCCGNPGITDYRICQNEESALADKIKEEQKELGFNSLLKTPNIPEKVKLLSFCYTSDVYVPNIVDIADISFVFPFVFPDGYLEKCEAEEEKYWNLALGFLAARMLDYEEVEAPVSGALDLLSTFSEAQAPKDLRTPFGQWLGEVLKRFSGVSKYIPIKWVLDNSSNAFFVASVIFSLGENLTDYQKAELYAKAIKERKILECLIDALSSCFVPAGSLYKVIEDQKGMEEFLSKKEYDFVYQLIALAGQGIVEIQKGGIIAYAGVAAGSAEAAVLGVVISVVAGAGFIAYKEYEDSLLYYRIAALLYTLAFSVPEDKKDNNCLFLKALSLHTANYLMDQYVIGKIFGIAKLDQGIPLFPLLLTRLLTSTFSLVFPILPISTLTLSLVFPTEKEERWGKYLDNYFDRAKLIITFWESEGELIAPVDELAQCLDRQGEGKICLTSQKVN